MISALAEFEREIVHERVRAGMDKAKAKGKLIGRSKIPLYKITMAIDMTAKGIDYKTITKKLEISKSAYFQIKSKNY